VANKTKQFFYRVNWQIRAPQVRLIDEKGKQIGIFSIGDARKKAEEKGLDLVEIAPRANPPVVKLIDYNKFKYQEAKKRQEEKKKQKGKLKEVRFTPFIGEADFDFCLKKIIKFLKKNYQVKIVIRFLGRQITKKDFGYQLIEKIAAQIAEWGKAEGKPKLVGKRLIVIFNPVKK